MPMPEKVSERRVVMAKAVARRWITARASSEYRLQVFYGTREIKGLPGLLRSFRDGRIRIGNIAPILDMGIQEAFDSFTIWSSDREGVIHLKDWFEERGFETTGIW